MGPGPWALTHELQLPAECGKIQFTYKHKGSHICVSHTLKIVFRVERGDDKCVDPKTGRRRMFDIVVQTPIHILSVSNIPCLVCSYSSTRSVIVTQSGHHCHDILFLNLQPLNTLPIPQGGAAHALAVVLLLLSHSPDIRPHPSQHLATHDRQQQNRVSAATHQSLVSQTVL
jgi:hypothetical protein